METDRGERDRQRGKEAEEERDDHLFCCWRERQTEGKRDRGREMITCSVAVQEEKEKEMKQKQEEQEMRKQMAQIRKEMQEARRQEAEERLRYLCSHCCGVPSFHLSVSVSL